MQRVDVARGERHFRGRAHVLAHFLEGQREIARADFLDVSARSQTRHAQRRERARRKRDGQVFGSSPGEFSKPVLDLAGCQEVEIVDDQHER